MGELYYCPSCGNEYKDCNCDEILSSEIEDEIIEGKFRFEYQHEGCSFYGTRFKKIMPDYED